MPRQARIDYPGALQHVIGRGIERRRIFGREKEKSKFLERVQKQKEKSSMQCYAWCIMDNHFHLLLQTGETRLSEFMRRVLTGYAVYYNKINNRVGHLFQNRYKSILCEKDEYLLSLVRYIHLNPVKAGRITIDELKDYRWTGHREIISKPRETGMICREEVLRYFGEKETDAKKKYIEFVKKGISNKENYEGGGLIRSAGGMQEVLGNRSAGIREMYDERILGSGNFVERVYKKLGEKDIRLSKTKDIKTLIKKIALYYGVKEDEIIKTRKKDVRKARNVFVYFANKYFGETGENIAKVLGIGSGAVSIAKEKGRQICQDERIEKIVFE